jgi:hypothetical protein
MPRQKTLATPIDPQPLAEKLSRELAIAGFHQVNFASRALGDELYRPSPDSAKIIACMKRGAVLDLLTSNTWVDKLIKENMVDAMAAMLDGKIVSNPNIRLNLLVSLATQGSQEMFDVVGPLVCNSKEDLFMALERAVDGNHLDTVPRLIQIGAPLLDPNPKPYEQKRVGNYVPSVEMFDLLVEHGYVFNKGDLLGSALSNSGRYVRSPQTYKPPRPDLLAHMIAHGTPTEDNGTPGLPFPVLLNQQARAILYREDMAACARILMDHGVAIESGYGTHLPALLVLSDAGLDNEAILQIADATKQWTSWKSNALDQGTPENDLMAARNILLELDARGIPMERLLQNTQCPIDWGKAFHLAGCEVDTKFDATRLSDEHKQLREAAKLQRATPVVNARRNTPRL